MCGVCVFVDDGLMFIDVCVMCLCVIVDEDGSVFVCLWFVVEGGGCLGFKYEFIFECDVVMVCDKMF